MKKVALVLLSIPFLLFLACSSGNGSVAVAKDGLKRVKKKPVIVLIDVGRIMKESEPSKAIEAKLQEWARGVHDNLRQKVAEYRAAKAMKRTSARKLKEMAGELQRLQQSAGMEYRKRQNQAGEAMNKIFNPLIASLARKNGWDVVVNKSGQAIVWSSNALDETDYVLNRLNATVKGKKKAALPSAKK